MELACIWCIWQVSTLSVNGPLSDSSGASFRRAPSPPPAWSVSRCVVHVEDNLDFAQYVVALLKYTLGMQVSHYTDGFLGLQGCLSQRPDLVVLDLDLPTLRGDEICRLLRSMPDYALIPILVCSSLPEAEKNELKLLGLGADAYLEKPIDEGQFLRTIERLFKHNKSALVDAGADVSVSGPEDRGRPFEFRSRSREKDSSWEFHESPLPADLPEPEVGDCGNAEAAAQGEEQDISEQFAGYQLMDIVGAGGMGTVYQALEPKTQRVVALKVLLKSLSSIQNAVERFIREGKIMEQLDHPNIVRVLDCGRTVATYFIAMEFVSGTTLASRIDDAQDLTWDESVSIISQMFDAVCYLHRKGILHRDLKPSNILISESGVVKLGDFGISRDVKMYVNIQLTQDATLVGTPPYMAPEQLVGAEASELTDQYSLARTVVSMFEGPELQVPPKPLWELRPDLPRALGEALAKCMHVYPSERYANIEDARRAVLSACN